MFWLWLAVFLSALICPALPSTFTTRERQAAWFLLSPIWLSPLVFLPTALLHKSQPWGSASPRGLQWYLLPWFFTAVVTKAYIFFFPNTISPPLSFSVALGDMTNYKNSVGCQECLRIMVDPFLSTVSFILKVNTICCWNLFKVCHFIHYYTQVLGRISKLL